MKFPIFILTSCAVLLSAAAHACSAISPTSVFIMQNDKNQDGTLNRQEWRLAKLPAELLSTQKIGRSRVFRKADWNSDGLLSPEELPFIAYKKHPCAEWEKHMLRQ